MPSTPELHCYSRRWRFALSAIAVRIVPASLQRLRMRSHSHGQFTVSVHSERTKLGLAIAAIALGALGSVGCFAAPYIGGVLVDTEGANDDLTCEREHRRGSYRVARWVKEWNSCEGDRFGQLVVPDARSCRPTEHWSERDCTLDEECISEQAGVLVKGRWLTTQTTSDGSVLEGVFRMTVRDRSGAEQCSSGYYVAYARQ